jgi:hypothetical protein
MLKRDLVLKQIELQEDIQRLANINIVTCGHCGTVLLHKLNEEVVCFSCKNTFKDPSDCPDYWYTGCENNEEFNEMPIGSKVTVAEHYINDEASGGEATPTAIVRGEINNDNLVCIEYENGVIDHVPQDIIRPYKESEISYEDVQQIATNIGIALFHNQVIEVIERYEDEKGDDPTSNWGEVVENIIYSMFN